MQIKIAKRHEAFIHAEAEYKKNGYSKAVEKILDMIIDRRNAIIKEAGEKLCGGKIG